MDGNQSYQSVPAGGAPGGTALLRLRAEVLLGYADDGRITVTETERDELERIAVIASEDDRDFLNGFDEQLERFEWLDRQ